MKRISNSFKKGFTLIEMLVVAPIVILAIGAFLTVIIAMVGDVLASRASNALSYDVQDALNRIEQDVKLSSSFLATNNVIGTAQGRGDDATAFTNINNGSGPSLILNMVATTANPISTTSSYVFLRDKPNNCATAQGINTPFTYNIVYFLKTDTASGITTLFRRTLMPMNYADTTNIVCSIPWQQPSCSPDYMDTQSGSVFCRTKDVVMVRGITAANFGIQYLNSENSTSANTAASTAPLVNDRSIALQAVTTVGISIKAEQEAAGRTIDRTAVLRVSRLDGNASSIGVVTADGIPAAPKVASSSTPGAGGTFDWPSVPTATGYTFQFNINGGAWQTSFTNQNTRTATINAPANEDIINARVSATNSIGTSGFTTVNVVTPLWESLDFQNNWSDYLSSYSTGQYTKTRDGVVVVKGLINRQGAAVALETIATLPVGYRPEGGQLIFGNSTNSNVSGRVDVYADGTIRMNSGDAGWFSLNTIRFVPGGRYTRTAVTAMQNGWTIYGGAWAPPSYTVDTSGRVALQGLVTPGTLANGTVIYGLPAALLPSLYMHVSTRSVGYGYVGIDHRPGIAGIVAKNVGSGYLSTTTMYYPASFTGWTNLTLQSGFVWYGGIFSTPQFVKSSDGIVSLKGLLSGGSTTAGTIIATLPVGSRPQERLLLTAVSGDAHARIDISAGGNITVQSSNASWLSLDGISFIAEQ